MRRFSLLLMSLLVMVVLFTATFSGVASAHTSSHATPQCSGYTRVASAGGINGALFRWRNNCTGMQHEQLVGYYSGHRFYVDISNNNGGFSDAEAYLQNGQSLNTGEIPSGSSYTIGCGEDVTAGYHNCA